MTSSVGTLDVYPSVWGHWAGGPPGNVDDVQWLDERLAKLLAGAPQLG
jgi:homoserine O-acetyltransferase